MDSKTQAKLDLAVQRYVDSLDLESICELAQRAIKSLYDVRSHYQNYPTNAEMYEFIDEMKVTDACLKGETK